MQVRTGSRRTRGEHHRRRRRPAAAAAGVREACPSAHARPRMRSRESPPAGCPPRALAARALATQPRAVHRQVPQEPRVDQGEQSVFLRLRRGLLLQALVFQGQAGCHCCCCRIRRMGCWWPQLEIAQGRAGHGRAGEGGGGQGRAKAGEGKGGTAKAGLAKFPSQGTGLLIHPQPPGKGGRQHRHRGHHGPRPGGLGDIVYVDFPSVGDSFDAKESFGAVES